jgi:peptidoglycan/xylan/chitin deacetylase (PgdA/CDA1 family)
MRYGVSRRGFFRLSAGAALAAAGLEAACAAPSAPPALPLEDVLVIDEADPAATPAIYRTPGGIAYVHAPPTLTPTPTATATPTSTPTPLPTPTMSHIQQARAMPRPAWDSNLLRQVAREGPRDRPLVALTIDDGWSARDDVVRVLEAKDAQLTLFLAGRPIAGDYGFVARALNAGCEIANHTMDHYDLTSKTKAYIQKDLADFEKVVGDNLTGASTKPYMRPSGGALNQTVIDASVEAGYRPVLWSGSVGDGSAATTPAQMVQYGLAAARPGAIILMHFSVRAITALPLLIDGLRAKGLEPVSLTRLFAAQA